MAWQKISDDILLYRDSCNVYAVRGPDGCVIIDAGTGAWLDHLEALPQRPAAVLLTHYFRDHAAGAVRASREGIAVFAPEHECDVLADPRQHFRERETYIIYDNLWDLFVPIEPVGLTGVMLDHALTNLAGLQIEVVALPGATFTQSGYAITLAGRRMVFCAEAIHSPGRLPRLAPLQYDYNDLSGALNCYYSAQVLKDHRPDGLLPSLGEPMLSQTDDALSKLQANLRQLLERRPGASVQLAAIHDDRLVKVSDHVWRSPHGIAQTHFIVSDSGHAMAIDYGYLLGPVQFPGTPRPARRRAMLHGLRALQAQFGIDRIDMVLVSHFHDDHVAGIPVLQRRFGTECWASENFADLLAEPEAHCFPCTWPVPISVHRRLPLHEPVRWHEYTFELAPMDGHTRFASLIGFDADGLRFAHTGDQYMYEVDDQEHFTGLGAHNYVYRNGATLEGYVQSEQWLTRWRPDVVISGHWPTTRTNAKFFSDVEAYTREFRKIHRDAMPLADDETHFDVDSRGGWIWPYRTVVADARETKVSVTVRNPHPRHATLEVHLVGPTGWSGSSTKFEAPPRGEVQCELSITPSGSCRRQPFAAELFVDGRPFGQVAEALMTVGSDRF